MKNFLKKASIILIILAELSCISGVQNNYVQANDIPFYKQQNAQDCGPTCLKMIAEAYGKKYDSQYLMKITNFSEKDGVSLLDLSDAANKIGFKTLAAKTTFQKLKTCPLPCIVHLPENHFVVISKIFQNLFPKNFGTSILHTDYTVYNSRLISFSLF